MIRRVCMVLLLVMLGICLFGAAEPGGESGPVIGPGQADLIEQSLKAKRPFPGGFQLDSLSIEKDFARACFTHKKNRTPICVRLVHPDRAAQSQKNDAPLVWINEGNEPLPGALTKLLVAAFEGLSEADLWRMPKTENPEKLAARDLAQAAEKLLDDDRLESARKIVDAALLLQPDMRSLRWLKVRLLTQQGDFDLAQRAATAISVDAADGARPLIEAARIKAFSGDQAGAVEVLQLIAGREGAPAATVCEIESSAKILDARGKQEMAERLRLEVLKVFPGCDNVWNGLGAHMIDSGRGETLLAMLESALEKRADAEAEGLLRLKAAALRRLNVRVIEQLELLERIWRLSQDVRDISMFSTVASQHVHEPGVYDHIAAKYKADPDNVLFAHAFAVLCYYRGEYAKTINIMDRLKQEIPQDARVFIYGAMSRYERGDSAGAAEWLGELQTRGTSDPDLYYCLAVLNHRSDPSRALGYLDAYLSHPPHPDDYAPKRSRALSARERLVNREPIPDWLPTVEKPEEKGCESVPVHAGAFALVAALFAILAISRRIIYKNRAL